MREDERHRREVEMSAAARARSIPALGLIAGMEKAKNS
jgi:hypothetical protein